MSYVLMVDDDEGTLTMYRQVLASAPFETVFCSDPNQAFALFKTAAKSGREFDLIITDLMFRGSGKTGVTLIKELRDAGYRNKVVVLTGYDDDDSMAFNLLDVCQVWRKPEGAMNLQKKIEAIVKPKPNPVPVVDGISWTMRAPKEVYMLVVLLCLSISLHAFNMWRSTYTVGMIQDVHQYIVKGAPTGGFAFEAVVPTKAGALPPPLQSGEQDIVFRVPKSEAAKVRELGKERGVRLRVTVQ